MFRDNNNNNNNNNIKSYRAPYITCKKVTLRRLTINNSMDVIDLHL